LAEWPLTILALLFLGAYAWPILDPGLPATLTNVCNAFTWIAWAAFAADYVARLALAPSRRQFVVHNLFDLAVIALPLLRPLRLLRLVGLLNIMNRYAGSLRGRVAVYVGGSSVLVVTTAALAVLDAERKAPSASIKTFGDAIWWALTTVTTVGYGDRYPVTGTGRAIAAGLMLAGIALLGVVTASLASWLIERVAEVEEESQAVTRADLASLVAEVSALRAELAKDVSGEG
jgi:voltage-gated potassium channel